MLLSKNKSLEGIEGEIVFETRNIFYVKTDSSTKKIPKRGSIFQIEVDGKTIIARGDFLATRFTRLRKLGRR